MLEEKNSSPVSPFSINVDCVRHYVWIIQLQAQVSSDDRCDSINKQHGWAQHSGCCFNYSKLFENKVKKSSNPRCHKYHMKIL